MPPKKNKTLPNRLPKFFDSNRFDYLNKLKCEFEAARSSKTCNKYPIYMCAV